jgi:hypothetical protein
MARRDFTSAQSRSQSALSKGPLSHATPRVVAFAKRQLLAHRQSAFDRRRTTRQEASMFTRVLATACDPFQTAFILSTND